MSAPRPVRGPQGPETRPTGPGTLDDDRLTILIEDAIEGIDSFLRGGALGPRRSLAGESRPYRAKLALLQALLEMPESIIRPELHPSAPLGHACRAVDEGLGLEPGRGLEVLEELADLGLLKRDLFNRVHACPKCRRSQLNFIETCLECRSIDIEIERLVHHFHCGYSGLESEYAVGLELVCPRCRRKLFQLGQDFERPHDTYVCRDCDRIFEEPTIRAQCFSCQAAFGAQEARVIDVHEYGPTALTVRAVELGRLTGLDVSAVMYDANVRLATEDYLLLEIDRETHRVKRYGGCYSAARLSFHLGGQACPIFREWKVGEIRELSALLTETLRPLDLVARLDASTVGLFFPETDAPGLVAVGERLVKLLGGVAMESRAGQVLEPRWDARVFDDPALASAEVRRFFGLEEAPE